MIIFGTRIKHKVIDEGQFYCPKCEAMRAYQHKRASRYLALYFVPVLPVGQLTEYVECQTCKTAFEPHVLQFTESAPRRAERVDLPTLLNTLADRLNAGTPAEYLVRDLVGLGLERKIAWDLVNQTLKEGRKTCLVCNLTYAATITTCAECHNPL